MDIPSDRRQLTVVAAGKDVALTNLDKVYWPESRITKGDLLRYYSAVSTALLPHLTDRAMVMKRYPDGIQGKHFFMKRTPGNRPEWLTTCSIEHASGNVIDFPVVQDEASLLWIVNLGCIDLNPWYAPCDDVHRPDCLNFDLDPVKGKPEVPLQQVLEVALLLRETLDALGMTSYAKTSGSRGVHVYVPIRRGPTQKQVWHVAKAIAEDLARNHPRLITAQYRIAKRPAGTVLVDYNQNAWGRTLASVYSVRPRRGATASAPISWQEVEQGVRMEDFTLHNMPQRLEELGDLWRPLTFRKRGRFDLQKLFTETV